MTARDAIAKALQYRHYNVGMANAKEWAQDDAQFILDALQSAPDSVRQELASLLLPWRPIETALKDNTLIMIGWFSKDRIWHSYVGYWDGAQWIAPGYICEPTHWLPPPRPPKEDKQ